MNFQDPKLILARAITLLYRENCLDNSNQDNSVELVRTVMREVYVQEHSIGLDVDKAIVMGLKNLALQMCDSFKDPYDKVDLLQLIRILAEEGEDEDEKAMVGKLALVNEAKKYLAEENGREATVQELAAYTQLTEEELSDILLLIKKADQKDK